MRCWNKYPVTVTVTVTVTTFPLNLPCACHDVSSKCTRCVFISTIREIMHTYTLYTCTCTSGRIGLTASCDCPKTRARRACTSMTALLDPARRPRIQCLLRWGSKSRKYRLKAFNPVVGPVGSLAFKHLRDLYFDEPTCMYQHAACIILIVCAAVQRLVTCIRLMLSGSWRNRALLAHAQP